MIRLQIFAFDKDSSGNYSKTIAVEDKEDFTAQVEEFEKEVPFSRFFSDIEPCNTLSDEEEKLFEEFEDILI